MNARLIPLLLSALLFAACKKDDAHGHAPAGGQTNTGGSDHAHGALVELGTVKLGDLTVKVAREGAVEAGKEFGVDLTFEKGKMPGTVRAWIGVESGEGSMKAKLAKETDVVMHEHLVAPKPIPAGAKLWIEAELASGSPARASIDFGK